MSFMFLLPSLYTPEYNFLISRRVQHCSDKCDKKRKKLQHQNSLCTHAGTLWNFIETPKSSRINCFCEINGCLIQSDIRRGPLRPRVPAIVTTLESTLFISYQICAGPHFIHLNYHSKMAFVVLINILHICTSHVMRPHNHFVQRLPLSVQSSILHIRFVR